MSSPGKAAPRIFVLLARRAPVGVVFRRGPSRQVLLIRWDTARDRFQRGQWFKGRIYERRCDLSPSGERLIYFAASFRKPLGSWTAISKPPYLTALALWPKGDCWNGGGRFVTEDDVVLNHPREQAGPDPARPAPKARIVQYATRWGEDDTVYWPVLEREGWRRIADGTHHEVSHPRLHWTLDPPETWHKTRRRGTLTLEMALVAIAEPGVGWRHVRYRVLDRGGQTVEPLGRLDWADWDHGSHLVFARAGCLFRRRVARDRLGPAEQLADFRGLTFEPVAAPEWARRW